MRKMNSQTTPATSAIRVRPRPRRAVLIAGICAVIVIGAIALDTRVVRIGSELDAREQAFSPDSYGNKTFPRIRKWVQAHAVEATVLGPEVISDKAAAAEKYGTKYGIGGSIGAVIPVHLTGTIGAGKSGIHDVTVPNLPAGIKVRIQTGAINGTVLRDAPGDIRFGQFTNQIAYQNAASGINRAMKTAVLAPIDTGKLADRTVDLTGAFRLINPRNWLITPVRMRVK